MPVSEAVTSTVMVQMLFGDKVIPENDREVSPPDSADGLGVPPHPL